MAKNTYFLLISFVQANDKDEFDELIKYLEINKGTKDIWSFLQRSAIEVGRFIEGSTPEPFAAFWTTATAQAQAQIAAFTPADPDNPTPEEQALIAAMVPEFLAAFAPAKAQALRLALENVRPKKKHDWYMILAAATLATGDARALQTEAFWDALAGYYLTSAAQYVAARSVRYRFLGRVTDSNASDAPKEDVRVACADKAFEVPRQFGITSTNREGYYRVEFTVLEGTSVAYPLTFTFTHPELIAPEVHAMSFVPDAKVPVTKSLAFTPLPSTSKTIASTGVSIPSDVAAYLASQSITITRLEDIRRLGALKNLPADQVNTGNADLLKLDGLASLELLQDDVTKNNTLYTRGYHGIADVALMPRGEFVAENTDLFGDFGSAQLHYMAKAGHLYGINQHAAELAPLPQHDGDAPAASGGAHACDCPDCKSGVSPLAYLCDLIAFTKSNLRRMPDPPAVQQEIAITHIYLTAAFHQRFGAIRVSCSQLKEKICQNRIAAEVLRSYLDANEPTGQQATALAAAEKEYLMQAYELLLGQLGTSYTELRLLRNSTDDKALQRLAERMGVVRTHGGSSTLDQALIDLSEAANIVEGQNAGSAKGLEQIFGLRDTKRDVFQATPESKVEQWKKAKLREDWKEADGLSTPYWKLNAVDREVIIDPDVVTIDDLRHPSDTTANGDPAAFNIWKKRRDWIDMEWAALDGKILPTGLPAPNDYEYYYAPALDHIKADFLIVAHGALLDTSATALSYDPLGPASAIAYSVDRAFQANGNTYFQVTTQPDQDRVGGTITVGGASHTNLRPLRNCTAMIQRLCAGQFTPYPGGSAQPNWTANASTLMNDLRTQIPLAEEGDEAAQLAIAQRQLDLPSAKRMLALLDQNTASAQDHEKGGGLNEPEWDEFKSILIQVLKHKLSESTWRTEENQNLLSPIHFRPAIHGPREGSYRHNRSVALIDPDVVSARDLPEVTALFHHNAIGADNARAVLEARKQELLADREALVTAHGSSFQALLNAAFISPDLDWNTDPAQNDYLILLNDLASAERKGWANMYLSHRLKLTETELRQVVSIGTKEAQPDTELTQGEKDGLYNTLLRAHKQLKRLAPTGSDSWVEEENGVSQWKLRKAALPKWRASRARRDAWLKALAEHSERPIIDADLIGPGDLLLPENGNAAYTLFNARWQQMHGTAEYPNTGSGGWINNIAAEAFFTPGPENISNFDLLTVEYLGHVESSLAEIFVQQEDGIDIRPRIAQLTLTPGEFNRLMVCRDILVASGTLTAEEKSIIQRILAQVQKRRSFFAYRLEEIAAGITLSQDHFKIREQAIASFPPAPDRPLTPWLAQERDLILWRRMLKGRVEQEKSVLDTWQESLFEVDEAMMVHLRDAMVRAVSPSGQNPVVSARNLGDQLLIDLENNCCYKTNRVAAAIETMQQLIWKTHTGDIRINYPTLRYQGDDFDEAWTWMGSYANWRAAMFVFLYPENVLHPSLRKNQTPAFREVVQATRNNRRFGPEDACGVAHTYKNYLKDVSNLELKCSIEASTFFAPGECGAGAQYRRTTFVFAQCRENQNTYVSQALTENRAAPEQTQYWEAVPNLGEQVHVFGADVFHPSQGKEKFLYLFFTRDLPDEKNAFYALRFDLLNARWEDEPLEFEVEQDDLYIIKQNVDQIYTDFKREDFNVDIVAAAVRRIDVPWRPPMVAISLMKTGGAAQDAYTFYWTMHDNGREFKSRWTNDGWQLIISGDRSFRGRVKHYLGLAVGQDTTYDDHNHSVFVLNRGEGLQHTAAWIEWNETLQQYLDWYEQIEQSNDHPINIAMGLWGTQQLIDAHYPAPVPEYEGTTGLSMDAVVRLHVGGLGPAGHDLQVAFTDLDPAMVEYAFPLNSNSALGIARKTFSTTTLYLLGSDGTETVLSNFQVPNEAVSYSATRLESQPENDNPASGLQAHQSHSAWKDIWLGSNAQLSWDGPTASYTLLGDGAIRLTPRLGDIPAISAFVNNFERDVHSALSAAHLAENANGGLWNEQLIWEAYYFAPMQIALQLHANGHYQEALDWFRNVYDFHGEMVWRKVWYGLTSEESLTTNPHRLLDWYADPLNPHAIAALRRHTYTRYTILSIVYCLLDYADAQFTMDTSESVPRARELYEDALDLMKLLVAPRDCAIDELSDTVEAEVADKSWAAAWNDTLRRLEPLTKSTGFGQLLSNITDVLGTSDAQADKLAEVNALITTALNGHVYTTVAEVLEDHAVSMDAATAAALGSLEADQAIQQLVQQSASAYTQTMSAVTGLPTAELEAEEIPWLVDDREASGFDHGHLREYISPGKEHVLNDIAEYYPAKSYSVNNPFPNVWLSGVPFSFCVVPNPIAGALVMKAEVELWKIHNCMNIAGMVRELDPFAAPTDSTSGIPVIGAAGGSIAIPNARSIPPSAYRYRTIVERARQLVGMAQQVEAAFLATLEKLDAERYSQLRAEQDIETSKANIKLQDLKINEANSGVRLAELQRERSQLQVDGLQGMIDTGLLQSEQDLITYYYTLATLQATAQIAELLYRTSDLAVKMAGSGALSLGQAVAAGAPGLAALIVQQSAQLGTISLNAVIQSTSLFAAQERRKQEWEFQKTLASQDVRIGDQQIKLANDRLRITGQEREIAVLQNEHARATLDFLKNKFTSAELYEWMSRVLEDAYSWFLQEATAMAILAERQLAFERQLDLPPFIRSDYWIVDGGSMGGVDMTGQGVVDRRGLTGSTRLLKDLTELDQYAFSTNSPKLQLTKTIALSELAPEELIALRDTGIARFYTTQDLFDRDFPGHYLRLIKRVSVTVIALTPPTKGIRATLTNGGGSHVVVGGTIFQERVIKRFPEVVAFSSGVGDHGVFQLQPDGEFLHPFEGSGVETGWEFRMEKAANPFDYNSIADVLFTIEYESLNSFIYRNTIAQKLNQEGAPSAIAISLKNNLPDQWFDLHNPPEPTTNYQVSFQINQRDLAPNLSAPYSITRAVAYVMMKDGTEFPYLMGLNRDNPAEPNAAFTVQGIAILQVPTDAGNGPIGTWQIAFAPEVGNPPNPFADKLVEDIFIILTYEGESTPYLLV